ncbi:MAG: hypothetical protein LBT12_08505 [Oscillospiraceae bacterium]|jgi:uncharacterized membrane protein|nr:hypothetical protein [Oscillospiraceae bacterium]
MKDQLYEEIERLYKKSRKVSLVFACAMVLVSLVNLVLSYTDVGVVRLMVIAHMVIGLLFAIASLLTAYWQRRLRRFNRLRREAEETREK